MFFLKQKINIEIKPKARQGAQSSCFAGFSLVETVVYISLTTIILFSLISLISSASTTYLVLKSSRDIERSAINIMNNIDLYANNSSIIDIANTSFDNASGSVSLIASDNTGYSTTTKIYLLNGQVVLSVNNVVVGPLNLSDTNVTNLTFRNMSTSTFNGFKIEMTIDSATSSDRHFSEKFYNSYILR